mmetsp:Transcript_108557/g.313549  ORF Transcript_108557/g.313549 Transcript_108557/m.313549 type:complete len:201 (-) Transcript_108557:269-871(-)
MCSRWQHHAFFCGVHSFIQCDNSYEQSWSWSRGSGFGVVVAGVVACLSVGRARGPAPRQAPTFASEHPAMAASSQPIPRSSQHHLASAEGQDRMSEASHANAGCSMQPRPTWRQHQRIFSGCHVLLHSSAPSSQSKVFGSMSSLRSPELLAPSSAGHGSSDRSRAAMASLVALRQASMPRPRSTAAPRANLQAGLNRQSL